MTIADPPDTTLAVVATAPPANSAPRLEFIDGLRAVAILLVLLTHTWALTGAPALNFHLGKWNVMLAAIPAIGYIGVDLFLVLSGFCLAWPFLNNPGYHGKINLGQFWKRRFLRIAPAYYISIVVMMALYAATGLIFHALPAHLLAGKSTTLAAIPALSEIGPHLLLMHNLSPAHASTINGSYWSLALEFQLYFFFPLLIELSFRWGIWRTVLLTLLVQAGFSYLMATSINSNILSEYEFVLGKSVFARMFEFCCGIAAAHVLAASKNPPYHLHWLTGRSGLILSFLSLGTGFILRSSGASFSPPITVLIDLCWAAGFALLLCSGFRVDTKLNRFLSWKPLVAIGVMSYSIYLVHLPLVERIGFLLQLFVRPGSAFVGGLLCIPIVIGIGMLFYRLVEGPFLNLARKSRQKPAAPTSQ